MGNTDEIRPPLLRINSRQRALDFLNAGIVDQDICVAVRSVDLGKDLTDLGRVRDVGREGQCLHVRAELVQRRGNLLEAFEVASYEDDGFGAGFGEGGGESLGETKNVMLAC